MEDRYNIQVLERAFGIMDVLLQARTPLSLEVIAKRANDQEGQMRRYHRDMADLKGRIESLE